MESSSKNNKPQQQNQSMNDVFSNLGAYNMGWAPGSSDYKQILEQLKQEDEMITYNAVINLSNSLSMAQENTLTNFNIDQFIPTLIQILKRPNISDISNEINLFTVQCLTNLMDIFPTICNLIINHGGVKCLCELLEKSMGFIDLNEQCIKAFEKLSTENPYAILTSGALALSLNMMDFFEHTTQKKIIQTIQNVSRHAASESDFDNYILPLMPCINMILQNRSNQGEERTEQISTIILRICETCTRFYSPNSQFQKVSQQFQKLAETGIFEASLQAIFEYIHIQEESQVQQIKQKEQSNQKIMSNLTIQNLIKALGTSCRFSDQISKQLIDFDIFRTLQGLLPSQQDHKIKSLTIDSFPFIVEALSLIDVLLPDKDVANSSETENYKSYVEKQKQDIYKTKEHQPKLLFLAERILPRIFNVYDNNMTHNIRFKSLQVIDKMIFLFDIELLNNFIEPYSFAKFIQTNFRTNHPISIQLCLQMVNKLIQTNPKNYTLPLVREGVSEYILKLVSKESIEKQLNMKVGGQEQNDDFGYEKILQARAVLSSSNNQESDRIHFEQVLQKYLEIAKNGTTQNKTLQKESCQQIMELAQGLNSKYFGNEEFMNQINAHCQDEYKILEKLQMLANDLKQEAQKLQFNFDQTFKLIQKLCEYITSNRQIMCYEFKHSGLLESLELFLTCNPKNVQLRLEQQNSNNKNEEMKHSEEMQLNQLIKDGKEISKKEARAYIQRLKLFANLMFKKINGKKPYNELVQLCHDLLSENETQIFQQSNDSSSIASPSTDVNQSINALRQLTQRIKVNLIYDSKKSFLNQSKQTNEQQTMSKSKSEHPAFAQLANISQKESQKNSKVYLKRDHLFTQLKHVLISVEQCASIWLLEDFLRNKIKTLDDVKSLKSPSQFLDQFSKKQKSKAARSILEKSILKIKEHFESNKSDRTESEQFAKVLTDQIVNSKELTYDEQIDIIRQLEQHSLQMLDELYVGEGDSLDENIEERLMTGMGVNEDSFIESEQRLYEFQQTLDKIKSSLKQNQQQKQTKSLIKEKIQEPELHKDTNIESEDQDMEDQSEEAKTEEIPQKDVEMTDEEEFFKNEIEKMAQKFRHDAKQNEILDLTQECDQERKDIEQVINQDLEELIKENGDDIEFEFYYQGQSVPQNQTIFEIIKTLSSSLDKQKQYKSGLFSNYPGLTENITIYFTIKDKTDDISINRKDSILEFSKKRERTKSEAVDDISVSSVNFVVKQLINKEFQVFTKGQNEGDTNVTQLEQSLKILKVLNYICKNVHLLTNQGIQFLINNEVNEGDSKETLTDFDLQYEVSQLNPSILHHHKLDSFIVKNIQDPYNLVGGAISDTMHQIFRNCPFLFPFSTRELFFKLISFIGSIDMNRSIFFLKQFLKQRGAKLPEDKQSIKITRQKAIVDRNKIVESALIIMKQINKRAFLEIEYKNEIGTGQGPTLEFYNLIAEELKNKRKDLWRKNIADNTYFPSPIVIQKLSNEKLQKTYEIFRLIGVLMAKSIVDDRLMDLSLSSLWWDLLLGKKMTLFDLQRFDKDLFRIFSELQLLANKKRTIDKQFLDYESKIRAHNQLKTKQGATIEDLCLYFILPGYEDIELKANGKNTLVTIENLQEYIDLVMHFTFHETIKIQTTAFKKGFNSIFPIDSLKPFQGTQNELEEMICGSICNEDEWKNQQKLIENIQPSNGYHKNSQQYLQFIRFITELDNQERRKFLQFITGSPRLPNGGFASLEPRLTVVLRKPHIQNSNPDNDLPSVMTCQNFVKLPPYSSYEILKSRFQVAFNEGSNNFNLS